jgi:hypothetical protein
VQQAKVDVLITFFAYSGNGGLPGTIPQLAVWLTENYAKMAQDPRIGRVGLQFYCDTPITMTRNRAVHDAQRDKYDLLLMLDSDNEPDLELGKSPDAKPFWDTSFTFAYERLLRGLPTVVCAPYSGPPPHPTRGGAEVPYLFKWESLATDDDEETRGMKLEILSRNEAALYKGTGIRPLAAGPTGVVLYTLNAFDLMSKPYFKYEYADSSESEKVTTEDVYNTREISMAGWVELHEDVLFANHDAWAGHCKIKVVGPPYPLPTEAVSASYRDAVLRNVGARDRLINVGDLTKVKSNGRPDAPVETPDVHLPRVTNRMIGGQIIQTDAPSVSDADLDTLREVVECVAQRERETPLRVVLIGAGEGEAALAITQGFLPAGGSVFCVDDFKRDDPADWESHFNAFRANVGERYGSSVKCICDDPVQAADALDPQDADLVVLDPRLENQAELIAWWLRHVHPEGFLAGWGHAEVAPVLQEQILAAGCTVRQFAGSSVWLVSHKELRCCLEVNT